MTPVAVRDLVGFVFRHGDLYPSGEGRSVEAWEGTLAHSAIQKQRGRNDARYRKEVSLKLPIALLGERRQLQGRIDGLSQSASGQTVIEEYKTSRHPRSALRGSDEAQAWLYAGMLATLDDSVTTLQTRVIYISPQGSVLNSFEHTLSATTARTFLAFALTCFDTHLQRLSNRSQRRLDWAKTLQFPHAAFRKNQRAMAGQVYNSVSKRENLLLEAVTGSGKTMAVLFPALKAQSMNEQFFFLTSRSRGADAALAAVKQLVEPSAPLRVVHITAKEKTCPMAQMTCDAAVCPNAAGYYSRLPPALAELEEIPLVARQTIEDTAKAHSLCPFELNLDAAVAADIIIGDYNYVFDPSVRLQRFAYDRRQSLLIDEAHQISPRVGEMLSVELTLTDIETAMREAPSTLSEAIQSLQTFVLDAGRGVTRDTVAVRGVRQQAVLADAEPLTELLRNFLETCDAMMGVAKGAAQTGTHLGTASDRHQTQSLFTTPEGPPPVAKQTDQPAMGSGTRSGDVRQLLSDGLLTLYFAALGWQRSLQWTPAENYRHVVTLDSARADSGSARSNRHITISRRCIDSSQYSAQIMAEHGAVVRFSGTVSPLELYQRLHGQLKNTDAEKAATSLALRAKTPFSAEQIEVLAVTDINTYYHQRLQTLPKLCHLLAVLQRSRPGRYLLAMPSYQYLNQLADCPDVPEHFLSQAQTMNEGEQQELLRRFQTMDEAVLGIVMGGVFGESIDMGSNALAGVVVVSMALPPRDLVKTLTSEHFDKTHGSGWGQQVAYLQPALSRIVQAAGRVIRGPLDKGVLCLVDPRFADPKLAAFFPEHWQVQQCRAKDAEIYLKSFWSNDFSDAGD
jgi:Rad3-related DNA helicase